MNLKYEVGQEVTTNVRVTETISSIEINLRGATYHTQSGKTYPETVLASIENKPISADKIASGTMSAMRDPYAKQRCANFVSKQEDKPKYKPRDKIKCLSSDVGYFTVGKIYTLGSNCELITDEGFEFTKSGNKTPPEWLHQSTFEPYIEPSQPSLIVTREMLVELGACSDGIDLFDKHFPNGTGDLNAVREVAKLYGERWHCSNWLNTYKLDISAMQNQPKHEAVTLYCFKPTRSSECFSMGHMYETDNDGKLTYENGTKTAFTYEHPMYKEYLIKTEKRPAKLGEYVLVVNAISDCSNEYKNGDILQIVESNSCKQYAHYKSAGFKFLYEKEYLVLPDYIPEKVEPTYYSGIVLCESSCADWWTVNKKYAVIDGEIIADDGDRYDGFESVEALNAQLLAKFIEFKGKQSC